MDQREGSERRRLVEIDELLRRELRTSAKNLGSLAAISEGNGKGEGGGGPGPFIGADGASFYCPNQWDLIRGKLHCGFYSGGRNGLGKKKMMRPDEWGLLVSEEERGSWDTRSG
jgi:hypothetical protein